MSNVLVTWHRFRLLWASNLAVMASFSATMATDLAWFWLLWYRDNEIFQILLDLHHFTQILKLFLG